MLKEGRRQMNRIIECIHRFICLWCNWVNIAYAPSLTVLPLALPLAGGYCGLGRLLWL
jgi:hypothetical protein